MIRAKFCNCTTPPNRTPGLKPFMEFVLMHWPLCSAACIVVIILLAWAGGY